MEYGLVLIIRSKVQAQVLVGVIPANSSAACVRRPRDCVFQEATFAIPDLSNEQQRDKGGEEERIMMHVSEQDQRACKWVYVLRLSFVSVRREMMLLIGTQFNNLYTALQTTA